MLPTFFAMLLLAVPAPDPTQVTQSVGESFKLSEKNEGLKATRALSIVPNDPCTITRVSFMRFIAGLHCSHRNTQLQLNIYSKGGVQKYDSVFNQM